MNQLKASSTLFSPEKGFCVAFPGRCNFCNWLLIGFYSPQSTIHLAKKKCWLFFFMQKTYFRSMAMMQHITIKSYNLTYFVLPFFWRLLSWLSRFSGLSRSSGQLEYLHRFDIPATIAIASSFNLTYLC